MDQIKQKIIGLTGGIASGKSTVSDIIKSIGYKVIDADIISREVVEKDKEAYLEVVKYFGEDILDESGNINRKKLGSIIFNNPLEREKLNSILHPYILDSIKEQIKKDKESTLIFVDIPLLIEVLDDIKLKGIKFDEIWLVYVDEKTQLERLMKRDNITEEEAIKRIRAQMPMEIKVKYATRLINNTGTKDYLESQVKRMLEEVM
ncbi:MAG: dephospho-CoA kinase [Tissierellia bacterium]|nr:dephospho-CoA kinase [Tissierellia bacterium]